MSGYQDQFNLHQSKLVQIAEDGKTLYDPNIDQWFRFETEQEALDYANNTVKENPAQDYITESRGADSYSAYNVSVPISTNNSAPILLLDKDVRRYESRIGYLGGTGMLIIGNKEQVQQGQGFAINAGMTVPFDTSAALWAIATPTTVVGLVSVLALMNEDV